jgi:hypothetical protein
VFLIFVVPLFGLCGFFPGVAAGIVFARRSSLPSYFLFFFFPLIFVGLLLAPLVAVVLHRNSLVTLLVSVVLGGLVSIILILVLLRLAFGVKKVSGCVDVQPEEGCE